jgi:hypothetical protein
MCILYDIDQAGSMWTLLIISCFYHLPTFRPPQSGALEYYTAFKLVYDTSNRIGIGPFSIEVFTFGSLLVHRMLRFYAEGF